MTHSPAVSSFILELPFCSKCTLFSQLRTMASTLAASLLWRPSLCFEELAFPKSPVLPGPRHAPTPACHLFGPPSALANLSPNPVDPFFQGASTPLHFHSGRVKTDPSLLPEYCWPASWPSCLLSYLAPSLAIIFIL